MVKRRLFCCILLLILCTGQCFAQQDYIKWVDFDVSYEAMEAALAIDIRTQGEEKALSWIDILALAATRCGSGKFSVKAVQQAAAELAKDQSPKEFLGEQYQYFQYYQQAYGAVLGGLVGNYAIQKPDGSWQAAYGIKAFSPIAAGYWYSHCDDFGVSRSYGFRRKHLGNDLMGSLGTPIIAVESGTVEALGWNQYGGWRVGIRSLDKKRYYYYAHLRKDTPYAPGLEEGDFVSAGEVIGFMGRTGYSTRENTNNIETVHLHFGLQLIFDESQKECDSEIWVNAYPIVRLLSSHRSTVVQNADTGVWERVYPYRDLDAET